jgi:maltose 6'-phosphate phosphatase
LLCGDFNVTAGSQGYQLAVGNSGYDDQYYMAKACVQPEQNFRTNDPYWQQVTSDDYRIDYIFMNTASDLCVTSARIIFTEHDYGRVSDHSGYVMTFEPK